MKSLASTSLVFFWLGDPQDQRKENFKGQGSHGKGPYNRFTQQERGIWKEVRESEQACSQERPVETLPKRQCPPSDQREAIPSRITLISSMPAEPATDERPLHLQGLVSGIEGQFLRVLVPRKAIASRLRHFARNWSKLANDPWISGTVRGFKIPLLAAPPLSIRPLRPREITPAADGKLRKLLQRGIIVPADPSTEGFYSLVFTTPKRNGDLHLIFNPRDLNYFVPHVHFKMESISLLQDLLLP